VMSTAYQMDLSYKACVIQSEREERVMVALSDSPSFTLLAEVRNELLNGGLATVGLAIDAKHTRLVFLYSVMRWCPLRGIK
jgi:hypothetical protein